NDIHMLRSSMVQHVGALASVLGAESAAALRFNDRPVGQEVLSSLRQEPSIEFARIYTPTGKVFASYREEAAENIRQFASREKGAYFARDGHLLVVDTIRHDDEDLGKLLILASPKEFHTRLKNYGIVAGIIVIGVMLMSIVVASGLQKVIAWPIKTLA